MEKNVCANVKIRQTEKPWKAKKIKIVIGGFLAIKGHLDNIETTGITFFSP